MEHTLILANIAVLLPIGGFVAMRSPRLMAVFLMISSEIGEAYLEFDPHVSVGRLNVYPNDAIAALLLMGFLFRLGSVRSRWLNDLAHQIILIFVVVFLWSLSRGILLYGQSAINEARAYIYFIAATLYFSTCEFRRKDYLFLLRLFVFASLWVAVLSFVRSAGQLGQPIQTTYNDFDNLRASWLGGYLGTTIVAVTALLFLRAQGLLKTDARAILIVAMCAGSILILQERTMWIASLVAIAIFGFRYRLRGNSLLLASFGILAVGLLICVTAFPQAADRLTGSLATAIAELTYPTGNTSSWRLDSWAYLLRYSASAQVLLLGEPFGSGFVRVVDGILWNVSPHNFYIQHILRIGIPGFLSFVSLYFLVLGRLVRARSEAPDPVERAWLDTLFVAIIVDMIVYMAWGVMSSYGMILGVALAATRRGSSTVPQVKPGLSTRADVDFRGSVRQPVHSIE